MRKAFALLLFMTPLVGVAPDAADAKKPSLRVRVHSLEKRMARIERKLNETASVALTAQEDLAVLSSCLSAELVAPAVFVLPGVVDPVTLLVFGSNAPGAVWMAEIDSSCLEIEPSPALSGRSFGPRKFRLVLP